jgi:predicted DNA-binding transcriptional regulator
MGSWNKLSQNYNKIYNRVENKTWLQCGEECMVSKDQAIGGLIFLVCAIVIVGYLATLILPSWLTNLGLNISDSDVRFWLIAVPVVIAFIAVLCIGAWIGWTMATTPPPKPIEEIEAEEKEEKKKEEEKE